MPRAEYPVNWDLLDRLRHRPHPLQKNHPEVMSSLPLGVDEVMVEALAAHHLLDIARVPAEHQRHQPDVTDLDARVFRLLMLALEFEERLGRLADWHCRESLRGGLVGDYCNECGNRWPCDTYKLTTGTYECD